MQEVPRGAYATEDAVALLAQFGIYTGITFEPDFDMSQIAAKSATAQVRSEMISEDHVAGMVEAMQAQPDREWPAILVWKIDPSATKYDVLNGLHRARACADVGRPTFPAVIVDLSNETNPALTAQRIKVAANNTNGLTMRAEDSVTNAVHLVELGLPVVRAAKDAGVSAQAVNNRIHESAAVSRLVHHGLVHLRERFSQDALLKARRISNDRPFREAILLAHRAGLAPEEQKMLFKETADILDQDRQLEFLATEETRLENRKAAMASGNTAKPVVTHVMRAERSLIKVTEKFRSDTILGMYRTPAEQQQAVKVLDDVLDDMIKARDALHAALADANLAPAV